MKKASLKSRSKSPWIKAQAAQQDVVSVTFNEEYLASHLNALVSSGGLRSHPELEVIMALTSSVGLFGEDPSPASWKNGARKDLELLKQSKLHNWQSQEINNGENNRSS